MSPRTLPATNANSVSKPLTRRSLSVAIAELSANDPKLARVIDSVGKCTLLPSNEGTHFDSLARSVVYQQLAGKAAAAIHSRFVERIGSGGAMPSAADVLRAGENDLRMCGLSGSKAAALIDLASRVEDKRLALDTVDSLTDEAVIEQLTQVRGIGPWTAQMFLMFRLGRPDVLPVLDLGVRKGAQKIYRMRSLPDAVRLERIARAWRPWRSVASWYCWRALEQQQ